MLFFANYGYHPRFNYEHTTPARYPQTLDAQHFANAVQQLRKHRQTQMRVAQAQYETSTKKHHTRAPALRVPDKVQLSSKNIRTGRKARKRDWKRLSPYTIEKIISAYAYRLKLPYPVYRHPVFHRSSLDPVPNDLVPSQITPPPPAVIIDDAPKYVIEEILDYTLFWKTRNHYVEWTGYTQPR